MGSPPRRAVTLRRPEGASLTQRRAGRGPAGAARAKLVLAVIDGASPAMIEQAIGDGRAPVLATLIERGSYVPDAVSVFPSVTPVCAASIATGVGPDRHHIPSMNWFAREEGRYVEYGSSFRASLRFGLARQLTDTIYNMNGEHLAADALTLFEQLDDLDLRTACTTYLIYRGRYRHEPAQGTMLTRIAARSIVRRPVMGPRELFYADIFESRDSGCRSTLGLPGVRDRHGGCVGAYLVEHDLFDFMLLSLPDNDAHSHRHGVDAQVDSIAAADLQLLRVFDAAGGIDAFLAEHAVVVVADHSHSSVERAVSLGAQFAGFDVRRPTDLRPIGAEQVALCPAQRSAMLYALGEPLRERVIARARRLDGVEHVLWRERDELVIAAGMRELRVRAGNAVRDRRGREWELSGELDVIGGVVRGGVLSSERFPDAVGRAWDAVSCPTAGDVLLSAAPGVEFIDWGGAAHVGGASHGSLSAEDSLVPLICTGVSGLPSRSQWSICDVAPLIRGHFAP